MSLFAEIEKTIERGFRRWTERMFGPAESNELLLVHRAILEEIEGKVQMVARGRRVFPFARVMVTLVAADAERRTLLQAAFGERLPAAISARRWRARAANCRAGLRWKCARRPKGDGRVRDRVRGRTRPKPRRRAARAGPAGAGQRQDGSRRVHAGARPHQPRPPGRAHRRRPSRGAPQRCGLRRRRGRSQRHGVAAGTRTSALEDGEYRLCDDGSEFGTRVFRDGRSIEVPAGDRRGEKLRAGDEIYLGRACLRFER